MNKYEKLTVVGEGVYGVVVKCKHKETGEIVAIKKFKESGEDEVAKKSMLREVKILRALKHDNIVQMREAFRRKGTLYLVFEFVEKSVMDLIEANPDGMDAETVRVLTCQLTRALEHCHKADVVHRDIKPENLLVNPADNALRLCDFGCARRLRPDATLTDYVATRWYRAPELLLSSTTYGKDVDMWALGCIMGEITDGQPLFAGESEVDQLCVIQKVLGPLTPEHMEKCLELSCFKDVKFPDVSKPETLEKRYAGKMAEPQMQLLKGVLEMSPGKRFTAKAALKLPWFKGIKLPKAPPRPPSPSQTTSRPQSRPPSQQPRPLQEQQPRRGSKGSGAAERAASPLIASAVCTGRSSLKAPIGLPAATGTPRNIATEFPPPPPAVAAAVAALGTAAGTEEGGLAAMEIDDPFDMAWRNEGLSNGQLSKQPGQKQANPYLLPWEDGVREDWLVPEYAGAAAAGDRIAPPAGGGAVATAGLGASGLVAMGGAAPGAGGRPVPGPSALPGLASAARWQTIGSKGSRWTGA
mmetsp:Transcript_81505/g.174644  ORF Transcript_81505/g.174644 Transcript_81505/m.174644 type:complete len:526 (-) Transcript_81505:129-1706(-)